MGAERNVQNILACQGSTGTFCVTSLSHAASVLFRCLQTTLFFRKDSLMLSQGPCVFLL
jgi:hypothetical protein